MAATPLGGRRTQEERSAAMRERLLDATIDCLVEYGYAGTTVTRVADQAGVTRGAQVHHFPTKADLVTAAIKHLAVKRTDATLADLQDFHRSTDVLGDLLDVLWEVHQGPLFIAAVELWVAARTDPELAEHMRTVEPVVNDAIVAAGQSLLAGFDASPEMLYAVYTAMDVVRGLLISSYGLPPGQILARWRRARELMLRSYQAVFPAEVGRLATRKRR
jgi:AcrR family transcriptional regulator